MSVFWQVPIFFCVSAVAWLAGWLIGELFLGWFCRMGTTHVRPDSRRPRSDR